MQDSPSDIRFLPPITTNTFGIPNERDLRVCYDVYKPSIEVRKLKSELGRKVFAEAFIEHFNVGTLSDLCVRTLARTYGHEEVLGMISSDPLKMRIHYDALSVDLPLDVCININSEEFWKRVVLTKSKDKGLAFKQNYNWKNRGVALKYVELVENCPAEYWPHEEMLALANKIKNYVVKMHITKLKSLTDTTFRKYFDSESEDLGESDSSDVSDDTEEDEPEPLDAEMEEMGEEEEQPNPEDELTASQIELRHLEMLRIKEEKAIKQAEALVRREARRKLREAKQLRRMRREALKYPPPPVKKKRRKKISAKNVMDQPLSEDEEEVAVAKMDDKRNIGKYLTKYKKYKYPQEDCHHVNLEFVGFFDNLTSFHLEFLGEGEMGRDYHTRHFNFSYEDMKHLATGLMHLENLKVFRLRNSRMDAKKLEILLRGLSNLDTLEVLDLGQNQLHDDCGSGLVKMFIFNKSMKSLELEGNQLGRDVMLEMANALSTFKGKLEYLGLSENPLTDEGLHAIVNSIVGTDNVSHLCLTGMVGITDDGLICCLANELLRQHEALKQLDLTCIPMNERVGNEILKALQVNQKVQYMDCRGCDLDVDMDFEIELLLKRNRYIGNNPYIGDVTKTDAEIKEFVGRVKNPILLKCLDNVERRKICLEERPSETVRSTGSQESTAPLIGHVSRFKHRGGYSILDYSDSDDDDDEKTKDKEPFVFEPNNFTEEEFFKHVLVPGPEQRYFFFKDANRSSLFKEHSQD